MDDSEHIEDLKGDPMIAAMHRLGALTQRISWFSRLGEPLDDDVRELARSYLDGLGFPDIDIALVENWETAELAAANPEIDDGWWDTEEQLRRAATARVLDIMAEDDLSTALGIVSAAMAESVTKAAEEAASFEDVADEALIRAAAGAATKACHQAALVILSEDDEGHPFVTKFRLFEAGRWPVSVTGNSFNLF